MSEEYTLFNSVGSDDIIPYPIWIPDVLNKMWSIYYAHVCIVAKKSEIPPSIIFIKAVSKNSWPDSS